MSAATADGSVRIRNMSGAHRARGRAKTGESDDQIGDAAELGQVKRQARRVHAKSALAALAVTGLALLPAA